MVVGVVFVIVAVLDKGSVPCGRWIAGEAVDDARVG